MGDLVHGFRLNETREIPQYHGTGYLYIHEKHNCPFFTIKTDDSNNTFSITFRTTCNDDSGSTHVLEHMVLHGSKKYPITDVFGELDKRSVSTYMNALTGLDSTCYIFASQNEKDFHNIMDVYLDAVFYPNLNEDNFLTECHRLEPTSDSEDASLKHSGVVYSEMCGCLTQPTEYFTEKHRAALLPDTPYKHVFGGDPFAIPNLTLDELKRQHKKYYSPSNCYIFHYGNFDILPIMERVNSFLEPIDISPPLSFTEFSYIQKPFDEPRKITVSGPSDAMLNINEQYRAAISWHIGTVDDLDLLEDFRFIVTLLSESVASPLYQKLIQTQIGASLDGCDVDNSTPNLTFSIVLDHIEKGNVEEFFSIVTNVLKQYSEIGFEQREIDSTLHSDELRFRSITSLQGCRINSRLSDDWIHGINPFDSIDQIAIFERLKQRLQSDPQYIQKQIKRYLIDNKSILYFVVEPKEDFIDSMNKQLNSSINTNITKEEKQKIIQIDKHVKSLVTKEKPLHLLPCIKLSDCSPIHPTLNYYTVNNDIMCYPTFCNGLIHVNIKAILPLTNESLFDIPFLSTAFGSVGCNGMDDKEFAIVENLYTSGIIITPKVISNVNNQDQIECCITFKTSFLPQNSDKALTLIKDLITKPYLDNEEHVNGLVNAQFQSFADEISEGGDYAFYKASSKLNRIGVIEECWNGLTSFERLKSIKDEIVPTIKKVYSDVFLKSHFKCLITSEKENIELIIPEVTSILKELNVNTDNESINNYNLIDSLLQKNNEEDKKDVFLEIDTLVNFCVSVIRSFEYKTNLSCAASLLANILQNELLHVAVREKIGAYGCWVTNEATRAIFRIESYRDTHSTAVLNAFRAAMRQVENGEITDEMVERAKTKVLATFDYPLPPQAKLTQIFNGSTNEILQNRKKKFFEVKKEEIVEVAKKLNEKKWVSVVIGNRNVSEMPKDFKLCVLSKEDEN
ncbi:Clan ME, family M16, insulinase-like metallopeptidase [Histomonas meleagridis]|uniref:Clan ME, family M16, insulinase-like metallopeptidase n=1 Tax=Histomonas meleagridis TaxID=135588 RepID=UPI00355A8873|nr:Clan ME, family M16, insulinase-like metallopeptidase [Histomonas meleagridis]KAH0805715.1 Clan ME, family M16, insulinase-like metallopeptidase [Histomonas meleagridis]